MDMTMNANAKRNRISGHFPREIEPQTAELWVRLGTARKTSEGSENTYYEDDFGNVFFVKDYPNH